MRERWRTVPGFPAYEVSNKGRVRRRLPGRGTKVGRLRKLTLNPYGYFYTSLRAGHRVFIHRLVCLVFKGKPPTPFHEAAHRNGKQRDNRHINLCWKTQRENDADKDRHGTRPRGTRHPHAKLNPRKVRAIRRRLGRQFYKDIGRRYGVSKETIRRIAHNEIWRHVR